MTKSSLRHQNRSEAKQWTPELVELWTPRRGHLNCVGFERQIRPSPMPLAMDTGTSLGHRNMPRTPEHALDAGTCLGHRNLPRTPEHAIDHQPQPPPTHPRARSLCVRFRSCLLLSSNEVFYLFTNTSRFLLSRLTHTRPHLFTELESSLNFER